MAELLTILWRNLPEIATKLWLFALMVGALYFGVIILGAVLSDLVWHRLFDNKNPNKKE